MDMKDWMKVDVGKEPWPDILARLATFDELDALRTLVGRLERRIEILEDKVRRAEAGYP